MNATTLKKSVIGVAVLTALAIVGLTVGGGPFSVSPTDTFAKHNPGTCQGYSATTDSSGNYLSSYGHKKGKTILGTSGPDVIAGGDATTSSSAEAGTTSSVVGRAGTAYMVSRATIQFGVDPEGTSSGVARVSTFSGARDTTTGYSPGRMTISITVGKAMTSYGDIRAPTSSTAVRGTIYA